MLAIALTVADTALKFILPAFVAWVGTKSAQWFGAKAGGQTYADALSRIIELAKVVVGDLHQTLVQSMQEAAGDGKITPEEWAKVKDIAVNKMKSYLGGEAGLVKLAAQLKMDKNALIALIGSVIESVVLASKVASQTNLPPFLQGPGVQAPPAPVPVALYTQIKTATPPASPTVPTATAP